MWRGLISPKAFRNRCQPIPFRTLVTDEIIPRFYRSPSRGSRTSTSGSSSSSPISREQPATSAERMAAWQGREFRDIHLTQPDAALATWTSFHGLRERLPNKTQAARPRRPHPLGSEASIREAGTVAGRRRQGPLPAHAARKQSRRQPPAARTIACQRFSQRQSPAAKTIYCPRFWVARPRMELGVARSAVR